MQLTIKIIKLINHKYKNNNSNHKTNNSYNLKPINKCSYCNCKNNKKYISCNSFN